MKNKLTRFLIFCFFIISLTGFSQTFTNVGKDFWIAFPPNQDTLASISLVISSNYTTSGTIQSAYPGVNQSFTVTPGIVTQLTLPSSVVLQGGIEDKGIRIVSTDPISVYGLNDEGASTDAFLALPISSLGLDYRIITYKTTYPDAGSCFSVVATQNGTSLTIFNHQTNNTTYINLDLGQTYHYEAPTVGQDVTGSRIQSNFPVAVFGSVDIGFVPAPSCPLADHMVEEMFPFYSWGKNFVTVPLAGRNASGDIFRIVAATDGTGISINGSLVTTINAGDYYETNLAGYNSITTSNATILAQFAKGLSCGGGGTGDPFMMLIPPEEQFLTNYTICNVAGFVPFTSHWVNVVAPGNALGTIYQDGDLIPDSAFVQIGATNYYGAQRSVTVGSHTFNSTFPFGVFVYGWGYYCSYGYPGGCSLSPVGTVNSITLSPDTAYGQLNVTNVCLTANVLDNLLHPVPGVLVNFNVSGISPLTGIAYSDTLGNAVFCYTQWGVVPGTDHVYAEVFGFISDTSTVIWGYESICANPTNGGTIGNNQTGCGSFVPSALNNLILPTGQIGTLEYKWQQSTTSGIAGFTDIAGSNSPGYTPGTIFQTTWFRRVARVDCMSDWNGAAMSNTLEITVVTPFVPTVKIVADTLQVCAGNSVTFTANPTNEGTNPFYLWKVNNINAGTNNLVFSYVPNNGDIIICILTSSETCTSGNPATSKPDTVIVHPNLPVNITISPSANPLCAGTSVTFTATLVNGGAAPVYQWKVNGIIEGTNNSSYSYIPVNGDAVSCVLTSNAVCATGNPATSNSITMTVNPNLPVSITISASINPVCSGIPVIFTAATMNGGPTPFYQWKVNGANAGTNSNTYTYNPASGDLVSCILTSNIACPIGNPATSNTITMNVATSPVVTFIACFDTITTTNTKPFKLKGGIPLGGTYSGAGVNNGIFNPAIAGVGNHQITYTYTNAALCSASAHSTLHTFNPSNLPCGSLLTDIRDGKSYQTVQIGSQCWMAEDLNYGTEIPPTQNQRDNCIPEKYRVSSIEHPVSLYQWDELMQYDETISTQGLCPPAWHVPSEADWNTLFTNYINNGFAASPLKYSGFSGFDALLSGARHLNTSWDYTGFATFFWSSTSHGILKAWAHGMNDTDPSVSAYPALRTNAFSVRCLKDN